MNCKLEWLFVGPSHHTPQSHSTPRRAPPPPFPPRARSKDVQAELLAPAVDGTRNVLSSVNRVDSVKRVILTSSIVSVFSYPEKGKVYTEADW